MMFAFMRLPTACALALASLLSGAALADTGNSLPIPPAPFAGKIAPGTAASTPAFPKPVMPATCC